MFTSTPPSSSFRPLFGSNNSFNSHPSCESPNLTQHRSFLSTMAHPFSSSASTSRCSTPSTSMPVTPTMSASPTMSCHSRESTVDSMEVSTPSSSRRRYGGGFWNSFMHHGKNVPREVEPSEDELMDIDDNIDDTFLVTPPPSLPLCSLSASYQCSETASLIPPSFYPGQSIPVVLTFELDRFSSLPHHLNPTLTMSLIGTLHLPGAAPRTIICVSVSLSEGLALWARDAEQTYSRNPPKQSDCLIDPSFGLPGGTYSLPLTVQVPSTPRLPPSFTVRSSSFAVTYALTVTLTCDDPALLNTGTRVVLADTAKPFEMMPETLPTRAPRYVPQSFYVKTDLPIESSIYLSPSEPLPILPKQNTRWTIHPYIPTTAYSPTSIIPFTISLTPPSMSDLLLDIPSEFKAVQPTSQVLVRLALVRREHSSLSTHELRDAQGNGLVLEEEIVSRWGWVESSSDDKIKLRDITLPLMPNGESTWKHGMSTMLNVGQSTNHTSQSEEGISVSSTFHLNITLAFLSITSGSTVLSDYLPSAFSSQSTISIPPPGEFSQPLSPGSEGYFNISDFKRSFPGTIKTLPLPIVVGSVSEPRGAMHNIRWSDLHLETNSRGRETGRMIHGESTSMENGWMVPPPCYKDAIQTAPYEFKL
ncbi:uncharacterized protein IL334_001461 [Kwoniella shivajii]|uniref:Arrestin-like N-terminal domain-containing protein n=1 Tax=Kwoniella shivajii TaxID=564305 RepID=A0ABZ1CT46_9TREE|nr:hypothetical protein IL334_001461 [Kwoniella shivajii]